MTELKTHLVPAELFDALAATGGDTAGVLGAGQRSKRLLLLQELIAAAQARAPEVFASARADEAFAVLADAQRRCRSSVEEVILHPHVGAWATRCLRILLGDGQLPPEDFGHLGSVAAAAAWRAGLAFEVSAHLRDRSLMLPTFGLVRVGPVGSSDDWCRIRGRSSATGIEITTAGTTNFALASFGRDDGCWQRPRRLHSSAGGASVELTLDDIDPFRGCGQLMIMGRLDDPEVADWQAKLDGAWALLVEDHPERAEAIAGGITTLVPLQSTEAVSELSATCHEASGAVALTPSRRALTLALALVHEFQHTKMSALLDLVPLLDRGPDQRFYAPWRPDPRPLRGLLQGTYAFLGLTDFWEIHRRRTHHPTDEDVPDDAWAHFEFALGREQVGAALDALKGCGRLRPEGVRFVAGMHRHLAQLAQLPVPSLAQDLAGLAYHDHAIGWRLRNLRPDPDAVAVGAAAWLTGRSCPWTGLPATTLLDGGAPMPSAARAALLRARLAFPHQWRAEARADDRVTTADVLLVEANIEAAAAAYRIQLTEAPDDLSSWAGLVLTGRNQHPSPASQVLSTSPELVYALHQAIRERSGAPPDVTSLATWLTPSLL